MRTGDENRDEQLFQAVQSGDAKALEELYDCYSSLVYGFALRACASPELAEEVTQDTFVRLWTTKATYDPLRSRFPTWLLTITHRLCQDGWRQLQRSGVAVAGGEAQGTPQLLANDFDVTVQSAQRNWFRQEVMVSLAGLSVEERKVIELAYFHGFTLREVAEQLQRPLGTVKTRLNHALGVLRQDLQGWKGEFRT